MGPLRGYKIIEIAGIGPGQLCGMLLADMGASLVRIDKPGGSDPGIGLSARFNLMNRSRPALAIDLKSEGGAQLVLALCEHADALFEGFRPGVMERLGLGPDECMRRNGRLVYGRMTGWGQSGPLADAVGHDGDYAAVAGAIGAIGTEDGPPSIPLNLVADFGGGGTFLAIGLLAALLEARDSGRGQVVDAAMVDGVASLMTMFHGLKAAGIWEDRRASNFLDGAAPFYRAYRTSDDRYVIVCAIEPPFYRSLLEALGIDDADTRSQFDKNRWPALIERLEAIFKTRTRDEWCALLEGTDACFAPVLSLAEAPQHAHLEARETFVEIDGVVQPAPAPRFSRTESEIGQAPADAGSDLPAALAGWGLSEEQMARLTAIG